MLKYKVINGDFKTIYNLNVEWGPISEIIKELDNKYSVIVYKTVEIYGNDKEEIIKSLTKEASSKSNVVVYNTNEKNAAGLMKFSCTVGCRKYTKLAKLLKLLVELTNYIYGYHQLDSIGEEQVNKVMDKIMNYNPIEEEEKGSDIEKIYGCYLEALKSINLEYLETIIVNQDEPAASLTKIAVPGTCLTHLLPEKFDAVIGEETNGRCR